MTNLAELMSGLREKKAFRITMGRGFHVTFDNGITVSVQFGAGNYCENRDGEFSLEGNIKAGAQGCDSAEIAVMNKNGDFLRLTHGDAVRGWITPAEMLKVMQIAASLPSDGEWPESEKS